MSYGHNRVKVPLLRNYAEALKLESEIVPLRGSGIKPMGIRRNKHMNIRKDEHDNVICRLYETDVVRFTPNGDILVRVDGWASNTTVNFMSDILGVLFRIFDRQVWVIAKQVEGGESMHFPIISHGLNVFHRSQSGGLIAVDPIKCVTHSINRVGQKAIRERYSEFIHYVDCINRLRVDEKGAVTVSWQELEKFADELPTHSAYKLTIHHNFKPEDAYLREFLYCIKKKGEEQSQYFYKAYLMLALSVGSTLYGAAFDRRFHPNKLVAELLDVLYFAHREEAFTSQSVLGQVKRDRYARYFTSKI